MLTTSKFVELALSLPVAMPRIGVQTPILLTRPDRGRLLFLTLTPPNLAESRVLSLLKNSDRGAARGF